MNNTTPSSSPAVLCPPCNGNGGLLQGCKSSDGFGEPSCQKGLSCRNFMGKSNICIPTGIGTRGNNCVPGYGDLMTCYDNSVCHKGKCVKDRNNQVNYRNMNGWVIAAIVCIIILLIILLTIGLVGKGKQSKK